MNNNTIKFTGKGNVKMIAHRGLSGLERENTNAAFVAAGQRSYYGIETDVHVTADEKYIIIHDNDLKRIADIDLEVEKTNFATLREACLFDMDGKQRWDLRLPSLEEYIRICKKYDKQAILELKNPMSKKNVWEMMDIIRGLGWLTKTTFISFSYENLLFAREKDKKVDAQFLTGEVTDELLSRMIADEIDADFWAGCVTKKIVDKLHQAGRKVNAWTIDQLKDAKKIKDMGVDFITTNILE